METPKDSLEQREKKDGELRQLQKLLAEREQRIEALERHIDILYHSRFVRPAIHFRLFILPFYTKFRRAVSRFVPVTIRRFLKRFVLRQTAPRRIVVTNELWKPNAPLITVVTPYFNRAHTIDETIASVFHQTLQDFEYILVDDGSTEESSIKKLDELAARWPKLKIIRKKNEGLGPARNTGIEAGSGKYVVCIDSDDRFDPTYLEKCVTVLETNPNIGVVTSHMQFFGTQHELYKEGPYNPIRLLGVENMLHCASTFRRQDWVENGGFKNIGHEDWEFWINLAEHGHFGFRIPEPIFFYRKASQSMFVEELKRTKSNVRIIKRMHPEYMKKVRKHQKEQGRIQYAVTRKTAFINLSRPGQYRQQEKKKKHVLIAIPFMTFGGAETLIYNFAKQLKDDFNISFVTFIHADNEWEGKFKEISDNIFHLPNIFSDPELFTEFIVNFIETRHVDIFHVVHNGYVYGMLHELRRRFPTLAIIVTLFNDRAHFSNLGKFNDTIDAYTADNNKVLESLKTKLGIIDKPLISIPNGIDCENVFNPALFQKNVVRKSLGLTAEDLVVAFVGRLSQEKKPDAFLAVAEKIIEDETRKNIHFLMIGDGPMRPLVEKTIQNLGSPRFQYLGYRDDIPRLLSASDVLVIPSTIEGSPQTVFEAASMGLVVVASDVGGISEILTNEKTGFIVPPAAVDDIVRRVEQLSDSPELLQQLSQNSRELMQHSYSIQRLKERYTQLYLDA